MFDKLKDLIGAEPIQQDSGGYTPSKLALKLAVPGKTNYDHATYPDALTGGDQRVLVICTEDGNMLTESGEVFLTGNHPVELFVVLLHLEKAGFAIDLATLSGAPVAVESWAIPQEDEAVLDIMSRFEPQLDRPLILSEVLAGLGPDSPYAAIFIPGGHGAILGLPQSAEVSKILRWALDAEKHIIAICHGPAAFLSLAIGEEPEGFALKGYQMSAFPDSADRFLPLIGYLPGKMPWYFVEKLTDLGMKNVSHIPDGTVHEDRLLLTGDGPQAANELGALAAKRLLAALGR